MPRGPKTRSAPPASQRDPVLPLVDRAGLLMQLFALPQPATYPRFPPYPTPLVA